MAGKKRTYSPYVQSCLDKCKSEFTVSKSNKRKSVKKSPIFSIDDVGGIEDLHKKIREFKDFLISKGLSEDEIIEHLNLIDKDMKTKKYGLVWEDREEDVYEQAKKKFALLTEVEDREIKTDDSKPTNLLIEGDNLESLLSLQYTHKGLVNLIYIDPPYNTGNKDFRYNDRYVDKEDTWRHSSWLSFMHKRLLLAKDLLADDGVIFISIDDNEFAQLKLLCDEIFGELNNLAILTWYKGYTKSLASFYGNTTEYILCYSKNKDYLKASGVTFREKKSGLDGLYSLLNTCKAKKTPIKDVRSLVKDYYNNTPNISKGLKSYTLVDENYRCYRTDSFTNRQTTSKPHIYDILNPYTNEFYPIPKNGWRVKKETYDTYLLKGRIGLNPDAVTLKFYIDETEYNSPSTLIINDEIGGATLKNILGTDKFSYPKPLTLIKYLLNTVCKHDAIIVDFFAGSGTTGHAVMELNKEDGGNRQFILCTNNENNICEEVTYQRLNKVINGYTTPKGKVVDGLGGNLKYYKTAMIDKGETYNENKSKLVSNMNSLISIKENAFNLEVEEDSHVVYSSKDKSLLIYNDVHIDSNTINNCIDSLNKNRGNKELVVYLPLDDSSAIDNVVLPTYQDLGIRFELIPKDYINQYKRLVDNRG